MKKIVWSSVLVFLLFLLTLYAWKNAGIEKGGSSIVLRLKSFSLMLNPLKMSDVESRQVATLLYQGLIFQKQDGQVEPALASKWTHTGNEWEFTLKPGLTFSNSTPVTSADVVSSICNSMQPSSPWAWSLMSIEHKDSEDGKSRDCTGIYPIDSDHVKITESKSSPWLLDALSGPAGWILPVNAKEQAYGVFPGTGPYIIKEIVPDVKVVLERRKKDNLDDSGLRTVLFNYLPDDTVAAKEYAIGNLHVVDLDSPQLLDLLTDENIENPKYPGKITENKWDRFRLLIVNEKALANKGFDQHQIRDFINFFNAKVDRDKIAQLSGSLGTPQLSAFPPAEDIESTGQIKTFANLSFPEANLTVMTEADPFSDLIAASLPQNLISVATSYKGVDRGILINSLLTGDFEIISTVIEATVHSPEFWRAFFAPGNPFSAIGKPIPGVDKLDMTISSDVEQASELINEKGNWIMIMKEKRLQLTAPGVSGIEFSPSGQADFAKITINNMQ